MKLITKKRADNATDNACNILSNSTNDISKELKAKTATAVRYRIDEKHIISESGNIIVTEIGFVTMALLSSQAIYKEELLLIPGVDDKNQSGYLVLRDGYVPYHSLSKNIEDAVAETETAHKRAENLLDYFGGKTALRQAAKNAPWYRFSAMEDVESAGLCQWGALSFLNRTKLTFIARHIGLPCFVLRQVGGYGNRIIAATTQRLETTQKANQRSANQPKNLNRRSI